MTIIKNNNSATGFSVAPMLDWTDKHCRYFHRKLTSNAWLYSEMVTTGAIIYGNNLPRFLGHNTEESPVVLQLGGSNPAELAQCAKLGEQWGFNEINLNIGCPSDRVQNNMIGACLMAHPKLVAQCVLAMKQAVNIPITVKSRIGIDDQEDFTILANFVNSLVEVGLDGLILHARKAWLDGLSPKQNREVPPLKYDWVRKIKQAFPNLPISINGGIKTIQESLTFLQQDKNLPALNGVMMGRSVYENPYLLAQVDKEFYAQTQQELTRQQVLESMFDYIENHLINGGKLNQISRHMLGLYFAMPGGRIWRRYISENSFKNGAGIEVLQHANQLVLNEIERMEDKQ